MRLDVDQCFQRVEWGIPAGGYRARQAFSDDVSDDFGRFGPSTLRPELQLFITDSWRVLRAG